MAKKILTKKIKIKQKQISETKKRNSKLFIILILIIILIAGGIYFYNNFKIVRLPEKIPHFPNQSNTKHQSIKKTGSNVIIDHGLRSSRNIVITFDADMTPLMQNSLKTGLVSSWYNTEIKKILDRENVKATIFFTGLWVETYPKQAKDLASDPLIEVANHSYSHPGFTPNCYGLPYSDTNKHEEEILSAQKTIEKITGKTPEYFRFPGGCFAKEDLEKVYNLQLVPVNWDVASGDGFNENSDSIVKKVESNVQNGSIIVFHLQGGPNAPKTHEALAAVIPYLKKIGYNFVTISELLEE